MRLPGRARPFSWRLSCVLAAFLLAFGGISGPRTTACRTQGRLDDSVSVRRAELGYQALLAKREGEARPGVEAVVEGERCGSGVVVLNRL